MRDIDLPAAPARRGPLIEAGGRVGGARRGGRRRAGCLLGLARGDRRLHARHRPARRTRPVGAADRGGRPRRGGGPGGGGRGGRAASRRATALPAAPGGWEPLIEAVGRVGYAAKGVAFAVVGVLAVRAAATAAASTAPGLAGARTGRGADPARRA